MPFKAASMTIGSLYSLIPRLMGEKVMFSVKAVDTHFWVATIGIVLYTVAMWVAGLMEGLQWRAIDQETGLLVRDPYDLAEFTGALHRLLAVAFFVV